MLFQHFTFHFRSRLRQFVYFHDIFYEKKNIQFEYLKHYQWKIKNEFENKKKFAYFIVNFSVQLRKNINNSPSVSFLRWGEQLIYIPPTGTGQPSKSKLLLTRSPASLCWNKKNEIESEKYMRLSPYVRVALHMCTK